MTVLFGIDRLLGESELRAPLADGRDARLACWRIGRDLALQVQPEAPALPPPSCG